MVTFGIHRLSFIFYHVMIFKLNLYQNVTSHTIITTKASAQEKQS